VIAPRILEDQSTIEWLPVSRLEIDMSYQRPLGPVKVNAISSKFNEVAAGVLAVNIRANGQIVVMDGQHRLAAMKKLGIVRAECKVCRELTLEQEAEIYRYCNTARKTPDALNVFKARLVEREPIAIAINNIVEKCGLSIQFYKSTNHGKRPPKVVWCVGALEEIYKRGQEKHLEVVLTLAMRCWPDNNNAFEAKVLLGIDRFHSKYQGQYSREEFIVRMSVVSLESLRQRAHYHIESGGLHERQAFEKALQEAYDKGRRTRRLEDK